MERDCDFIAKGLIKMYQENEKLKSEAEKKELLVTNTRLSAQINGAVKALEEAFPEKKGLGLSMLVGYAIGVIEAAKHDGFMHPKKQLQPEPMSRDGHGT